MLVLSSKVMLHQLKRKMEVTGIKNVLSTISGIVNRHALAS
jgi:hypothetical protein